MSAEDANNDYIKINKWDGSAVKHAIDDAVKKALIARPNHLEHFGLVDGRLAISALSVALALFALAWDFKHPFPLSRPILIGCVCGYFVLMGLLTLYMTFCEKGIFAVAVQKVGTKTVTWKTSSGMQRYDDQYTLYVACRDSKQEREAQLTRSCAHYIDVNGVVNETTVANDLSKLINILNNESKSK